MSFCFLVLKPTVACPITLTQEAFADLYRHIPEVSVLKPDFPPLLLSMADVAWLGARRLHSRE